MHTPIVMADGVLVHTHACGEDGIFVNAFLVESAHGVVAVDATLTVSTGRSLRARLEALHKPLLAVLVTHPHPDHVAGLAELVTGDTPILATAAVTELGRALEEPKRRQWGPVYGAEWVPRWRHPDRVVVDGEAVVLDGVEYRVHDLGAGGDSDANALWTLTAGAACTAFLGDLVFNGVHSYLADGGVLAWLANLERAAALCTGMATVFPGHGAPGAPAALFARQRAYLLATAAHVKQLLGPRAALDDRDKQELTRRMAEHLPGAGLELLVAMGADAVAAEVMRRR